jgi:hypothetical protein
MTSNASPDSPPFIPKETAPFSLAKINSHGDEAGNVLVPTPASLAAQYKDWLENIIIQEFRDKYNQADARVDLAALRAAASQVIESPCTNAYKISQGEVRAIS